MYHVLPRFIHYRIRETISALLFGLFQGFRLHRVQHSGRKTHRSRSSKIPYMYAMDHKLSDQPVAVRRAGRLKLVASNCWGPPRDQARPDIVPSDGQHLEYFPPRCHHWKACRRYLYQKSLPGTATQLSNPVLTTLLPGAPSIG